MVKLAEQHFDVVANLFRKAIEEYLEREKETPPNEQSI